ncbi:MAG TPA: CYTH and CHAD domain-containing protein [Acidimicrobiales bacterium]|nr:CYTH and CHAD domain-containing protein [Acidimicrobiales bacterium]
MGVASDALEREVKLGVWPGFRLPELDGVLEGVVAVTRVDTRLDATYHDTPDLRLARSGVTLRHRSAEGWTLKLPSGQDSDGMLSRRELTVSGDDSSIPAPLARLVAAWVRTATLVPVARLRTLRRGVDLVDDQGSVVAEVVDDEVSLHHGRRVALRFREVEVELRPAGSAALLDAVVSRLQGAGAGPGDRTPKVVRALGPRALEAPELGEVAVGKEGSAAAAIRSGLAASVRRLLAHDVGVRVGDDAEDVHQARVATRRLRSDLRTYATLLDEEWARDLRAELKWVADALGAVRDTDVLLERLQEAATHLHPLDNAAMGGIVERLQSQRSEARARLSEVMDDRRYVVLLDRLVDALDPSRLGDVPAVATGTPPVIMPADTWLSPEADAPAAEVLPPLVHRPWKHLREAVAAVEPDGPDEELHQVRIRAKRCRYAAEVAAVAVGKPARRLASAVADLQEVLGEHQDAVVAEAWLRTAVPELSPREALVAGQLVAGQRAVAETTHRAWPDAWKRANRAKLRAWMG